MKLMPGSKILFSYEASMIHCVLYYFLVMFIFALVMIKLLCYAKVCQLKGKTGSLCSLNGKQRQFSRIM